jgi:hypothetical protein
MSQSEDVMREFRVGLTATLAVYGIAMLAAPSAWSVIDALNLPVHETGHVMFAAFGGTLTLLGGTLLQLLLPLAFAAYFTLHADEHAASLAIWWVGQNFVNVSVYMADAPALDRPPFGGGEHDWNILFSQWGVLGQAGTYANLARGFGFLVMLVATVWGVFEALNARHRVPARRPTYTHARRRR